MEREPWSELSAAIYDVGRRFKSNPHDTFPTSLVVKVFCWAVIHQASVNWACQKRHWPPALRPARLPDQSTMSRRMQRPDFETFLQKLGARLQGRSTGLQLVQRLDAKPLPVAAHSKDPQAGWGRGAGQKAKGYKLHTIWGKGPMPLAWRVAPLNVSEQEMARRMLRDLRGQGYVLADKNFDSNELFDLAAQQGYQLLCRRRYGKKRGLGHQYQSPHRLRCKDLLEGPSRRLSGFGPTLLRTRGDIERSFGNCCSFTGGLTGLPPWVRHHRRVKRWVWAKLLINAARIRCLRRRRNTAPAA